MVARVGERPGEAEGMLEEVEGRLVEEVKKMLYHHKSSALILNSRDYLLV
jgi:hypothetical protein